MNYLTNHSRDSTSIAARIKTMGFSKLGKGITVSNVSFKITWDASFDLIG